jgi:hypothetical protein
MQVFVQILYGSCQRFYQAEQEAKEEQEKVKSSRQNAGGEYDEEEEQRQREKDDWKDSNPRGWGNSAIRPCGR